MLKIALIAGAALALAPVQTSEVSGSNINGDTEAAMRLLHGNATGRCGLTNREAGYTASNVRCTVEPRTVSGQTFASCRATITCTNQRPSGPPPVPQPARPQ
ncbi:MAG: hypothetical protein K2X61_11250 [Caulobacteraceae bacterium]|nr:hypothetical protein [Caulobacteraceae bacterium]